LLCRTLNGFDPEGTPQALIRALERELGEPLFERAARRVTLTSGGRVLLPFRRVGLTLTVAYASDDPSLHIALAKQGVGTALAAGADPSVRNAVGVTCLPLDPPIPYDKLLIWRTAEPPPAPVRALLNIWHQLSGNSSSSDSEQSANE
jgi:DNA-binding transcriptional LysR family regulator